MIGRLIKKNEVGTLQKNLCKFHPHAPATAELGNLAVEVAAQKAQAFQNPFNFGFHIVHTDDLQMFVEVGKVFSCLYVRFGSVVGTGFEFGGKAVDFALDFCDIVESLLGFLKHSILR